jgi:hypothetical protein
MAVPSVTEPAAAPSAERLSEQPIKFDQAALLRQDPPSRGRIAWLTSILVLAVLLLVGVMFRNAVSTAWPPSLRLYQAVGLMPKPMAKPAPKPAAPPTPAPTKPAANAP